MTTLTLLLAVALTQGVTTPSSAQVSPDTGQIRGRITDKETGQPIPGAVIRLADEKNLLMTRADEEGRYQFTDLAPGSYAGLIEPPTFHPTHLVGSSRGIVLKPGEIRRGVDVALVRARAMTVRVVDEAGEPLAGLRITVNSTVNGRNVNDRRFADTTDDLGRLRLYGLPRGRYIVCAESFASFSGRPRPERFVRTCYPSAAAAQAEPVVLETSDIEALEIRMRRGRTFTISGILSDSSGVPASGAMVGLSQFTRNGSSSTNVTVSSDGRFTMSNVEPGEYAIEAWLGGPERPEQRRALEGAFVPVRVDAADIDLVVSTTKAVEVAGRIMLDDPSRPLALPPRSAPILVRARLAGDQLPGAGSMRSGTAHEDRVFYLDRMFGRRTLEVLNVPRGWYVKSIRYEGKDIIEVPTEFKASRDPSGLEIVLSARGAVVTGRVTDERGEAVSGARVMIFPADPLAWLKHEPRTVTVSSTGAFRLGPLRGGEYLVVALDPSVPVPETGERDALARLAESAERIRLNDLEERALDLRVVKVR